MRRANVLRGAIFHCLAELPIDPDDAQYVLKAAQRILERQLQRETLDRAEGPNVVPIVGDRA